MESKNRPNGVVRHHLAKDNYDASAAGHKTPYNAEDKGSSGDAKGTFALSQEKEALREVEEELEADDEFERLKRTPEVVVPVIAPTKYARNFVAGFRILSMNMKDAHTGTLIWFANQWDPADMFDREIREEVPKEVLKCKAVAREIVFSSAEEVAGFRLVQRVYFRGTCIEEWFFQFGFVIPGSTNTWQQTIEAAPASEMLPAEALSGNVVFETSFYDGEEFLCKNSVRLYYV